jgi:hypothetical protein
MHDKTLGTSLRGHIKTSGDTYVKPERSSEKIHTKQGGQISCERFFICMQEYSRLYQNKLILAET